MLKLHSELIIDYTSSTGLTIKPGNIGKKNPFQRLKFIDYIWTERKLDKALQAIIDNPHKTLISEEVSRDIDEVGVISPYRIMDMAFDSQGVMVVNSGGHFKIEEKRFAFTKAYDEVVKISYDTYPNRFVKFFLKYLYTDLHSIIEAIQTYIKPERQILKSYYEDFINRANEIKNKYVLRFLSRDFFKEVSDLKHLTIPPQVLLKEDRYQTVFTSFQDLLKGVIVDAELEQMLKDPITNMPELYEYWCFLKTWELIKQSQGSGKIDFEIEGGYGEALISKWKITWDKYTLTYQEYIFNKENNDFYSYSVPFEPDIFLECNNSAIIFDAKYRVDFMGEIQKIEKDSKNGINELLREERTGTYKLADLYKMHTYREAIIRKDTHKRPIWVIALYPGDEIALFPEDHLKTNVEDKDNYEALFTLDNKTKEYMRNILSSEGGGVGAIPMRPKYMKEQEYKELISSFIAEFHRSIR